MKTPSKYIVLAGTFFTSLSSILIRFSQAPALVISAYRMLFTIGMLLIPVMMNQRNEFKQLTKKEYLLCILSGIFLALHYAAWISSIKLTTVANSTILVSCSPIFVALLNYFIANERINHNKSIGILLSLAGTIIIAMGSLGDSATNMMVGNILAFLGAVFIAGYLVIGGIVRQNISAGVYVFVVYSVSTIVLFAMCIGSNTPLYPYSLKEFLIFAGLAFFCTILGHTVYNYMVKYVSSTLISVSTLSEPIFASLMAMIIFKEFPSIFTLVGGVIIIAGILYYLLWQNKEKENSI